MDYLIEHEEDQITVIELVDKMSEFCGDMAYTSVIFGVGDGKLFPVRKLTLHFW
jgi:hypothetical protein